MRLLRSRHRPPGARRDLGPAVVRIVGGLQRAVADALVELDGGHLAEFAVEAAATRARARAALEVLEAWTAAGASPAIVGTLLYDIGQCDRALEYVISCLRRHRLDDVHRGRTPLLAIERRLAAFPAATERRP